MNYANILVHLITTGQGFCSVNGAIVDRYACQQALNLSCSDMNKLEQFTARLDDDDVKDFVQDIRDKRK